MGNIIKLNGGMYDYIVPLKEPSDEKLIINFDKRKDDQFWRTPIIPNVKHLSQKDRIEFIERERQRWVEGCYILINGELVYLTGMHYDHLTYMTFKAGKAEYFDHQRFDFYFRDLVRRDVKARGQVFMKPRRYGMTMEEQTQATYTLLENFSNNVGLQSDTDKKTKSTLLEPILQSYVNRPKYMRSDYYKPNGKMPIARLDLKSNMAPGEDGVEKGDYILGWVRPFPSQPRQMDGEEVTYAVDDEVWKWLESSPKETIESNMKALMGRKRAGKISVLSTMGDSDDYLRSIMDGIDIIARSNPNIRDDNGYTLSGLYEYFVSAIYSFDIPPDVFEVNKFGKVNADKHLEYINNKLNKLDKSSKSYVFEKRRLPLTKEDALLSANTQTYFRRVVINSRLAELRGMTPNQKMDVYMRGNLEEDATGKVAFVYHPEGIWLWAVQPFFSMERNVNCRNRFRKSEGTFFPPINPEGAIGYDPINYPKGMTTSSNLSRAAAIIHKKFDYFNAEGSVDYCADVKMALMVNRPDDPHDANREVIKVARYTGYVVMHERSVSHVMEDFEEANMLPFLLKDKAGVYGISPSDMKAKKDGLSMLQTRYAAPKNPNDVDQLDTYPFEDGLIDLDNFDIGNTGAFDVTMSEIYLEHGLKQVKYTNLTDAHAGQMADIIHEIIAVRNK